MTMEDAMRVNSSKERVQQIKKWSEEIVEAIGHTGFKWDCGLAADIGEKYEGYFSASLADRERVKEAVEVLRQIDGVLVVDGYAGSDSVSAIFFYTGYATEIKRQPYGYMVCPRRVIPTRNSHSILKKIELIDSSSGSGGAMVYQFETEL
jgi:hypothetical protein